MAKRIEKKDDAKRSENFRHNRSKYTGYKKKNMSNKKTERAYEEGKIGSDRNDPSWYTGGQMAGAASNLFFTHRFGDVIRDLLPNDFRSKLGYTNNASYPAIPGIMVLNTVSTFGEYKSNEGSPINIAAQAMYSFVRYANSGSRNYDSPDLMTYVLALEELYSFIVYCQRTYGFLNTYFPQNNYMPRDLVNASGFNYTALLGQTAQFCYWLNSLIAKATAFALPADFYYTQRKVFMYQNVFIESDNIKDQMYMFKPTGFYQYTVDAGHPEAYLKYKALPSNLQLSTIMAYGDAMVQALLDNEDAGIISGDIIKAYGLGSLVKLAEMPLGYNLIPIVGDENIMYQIRNCTIIPEWCYNFPDLYQDNAKLFLEFHPQMRTTANDWSDSEASSIMYLMCGNRLLTSNKTDPGSDDVMESTRLMVQCKDPLADGSDLKVDLIPGSEIVTKVTVWYHSMSDSDYQVVSCGTNIGDQFLAMYTTDYIDVPRIAAFRYHPTFFICSTYTNNSTNAIPGFLQECETITTVDAEELSSIHNVAWLNMLAVPSIAKLR